jgi:glyoxylase-like metal-dependent hydrolase (beta-lactamase superfamily II)
VQIKVLETPPLDANCYIVACEKTNAAVIIDPGGNFREIKDVIDHSELSVKAIINTHGHVDHIGANGELKQATGAPLLIGMADAPMLPEPSQNLSAFLAEQVRSPEADRLLQDGDCVTFGEESLQVIATPGHTKGGLCLYSPAATGAGARSGARLGAGVLFSGDTLFAGSIGRSDLPSGNGVELVESIRQKLLTLPDDTVVYPGHGETTTIGEERRFNPFL